MWKTVTDGKRAEFLVPGPEFAVHGLSSIFFINPKTGQLAGLDAYTHYAAHSGK